MTPEQAPQALDVIEVAELIEAETQYRLQMARDAYEAGRQAGYRQAEANQQARWRQADRLVVPAGPSHTDLEARRWGPGGRTHFADPRPGDFPGRSTQPQPEPETQPDMEATP